MSYTIDKTEQLIEAGRRGYGALKASLQAQGVPFRQHKGGSSRKAPPNAGRTAAKTSAVKKTAAKKTTTKKSAAKKTAKKS